MENKIINVLKKLLIKAVSKDEVPVAAVIVYNNKIIAKAYNKRNKSNKTIDHAEIEVINIANKKLKNWRLNNCSLYTTLEPCNMCKEVIKESRMDKVFYYLPRINTNNSNETYNIKHIEQNLNNTEFINFYKDIFNDFWKNKR